MRPSVWKRLLGVDDKTVIEGIEYDEDADAVIAHVRVRKPTRPRRCGRCQHLAPGFDQGDGRRRWRALDLGTIKGF